MLAPNDKNYKAPSILVKVFAVFDIILIILVFILTCLTGSYKELPETPLNDIYIAGLKSFSFEYNSKKIPYKYGMPNLGKTSELKFNCYSGLCQKYVKRNYNFKYESYASFFKSFSSKINSIENKDKNSHKNKNNDIKTFYQERERYDPFIDILDLTCAEDCAKSQAEYCYSCPKEYFEKEGLCKFEDNAFDLKSKYCFAEYLILKWKGNLYSYENVAFNNNITYINSAILPGENCPENKKLCGILDNNGNKLCLPKDEKCPINKIVVSDSEPLDYNYNQAKINNISIYYTNEAVNDGIIVNNLYVDSDLLLQYNEGCYKIDEGTIEELVQDNENIYDDISGSGKSYLKWCNNGYNININLSSLRREYQENSIPKYLNENVIKVIKDSIITESFGVIALIFFLSRLPYFVSKKDPISFKGYIGILIFFIVVDLLSCIMSIVYDNKFSRINDIVNKNKTLLSINSYKAIVGINKAFYIINCIYLAIIIIWFIYSIYIQSKKPKYIINREPLILI